MILIVMSAHKVLAQDATLVPVPVGAETDNIFLVMWRQVISNPNSLLHGLIMCIVAWLIDETTWINSRYIPHITITLGAFTYWLYAGAATVAHCYPYPWVVLGSNGMISGLIAYGGHRQIIARILCFARQRAGSNQFLDKQNQPTNP